MLLLIFIFEFAEVRLVVLEGRFTQSHAEFGQNFQHVPAQRDDLGRLFGYFLIVLLSRLCMEFAQFGQFFPGFADQPADRKQLPDDFGVLLDFFDRLIVARFVELHEIGMDVDEPAPQFRMNAGLLDGLIQSSGPSSGTSLSPLECSQSPPRPLVVGLRPPELLLKVGLLVFLGLALFVVLRLVLIIEALVSILFEMSPRGCGREQAGHARHREQQQCCSADGKYAAHAIAPEFARYIGDTGRGRYTITVLQRAGVDSPVEPGLRFLRASIRTGTRTRAPLAPDELRRATLPATAALTSCATTRWLALTARSTYQPRVLDVAYQLCGGTLDGASNPSPSRVNRPMCPSPGNV